MLLMNHMLTIDIGHMFKTLKCCPQGFTQHLHPFAKTFVLLCLFFSLVGNSHDTPSLIDSFLWSTIAIVVNSHCLKACTMHPTCFNTRHQIFMFDSQKTTFTFKFHLSCNGPPSGKREVFISFALIACNVVSWNIPCVLILIGVNQGLYNCCKS